jgi:hypothetical protein
MKIFKEKIENNLLSRAYKEVLLSLCENRPIKPEIENKTDPKTFLVPNI